MHVSLCNNGSQLWLKINLARNVDKTNNKWIIKYIRRISGVYDTLMSTRLRHDFNQKLCIVTDKSRTWEIYNKYWWAVLTSVERCTVYRDVYFELNIQLCLGYLIFIPVYFIFELI